MFEPAAGETIIIGGNPYQVAPHPSYAAMPYGQEGRQAVVYKLINKEGDWALKVFKPRYRRPYLVRVARKISSYAELPGLEVCNRTVVSTERNLELLKAYPELVYAALMPWVEGPTWMEIIVSRRKLEPRACLSLARHFLRSLVALEEEGLAHGDLSGANTILPALNGGEGIALVDVEQMYGPGMERPEALTESSPGYGFPGTDYPVWGPYADRYPGSIMLAEMLGFCDDRVVQGSSGESFFSDKEPGTETERYGVMVDVLNERWGKNVASLFRTNWFSDAPEDCSPFAEWLIQLPEESLERQVEKAAAFEPVAVNEENPARRTDLPTVDLEQVLLKANRLKEEGELHGALELYQYLQTVPLADVMRAKVQSEIVTLEAAIAAASLSESLELEPFELKGTVKPQRRMSGARLALVIGLPALLLMSAIAFAMVFLFNPAKQVSVPDVYGLTQQEAEAKLKAAGFKLGDLKKENSDRVDEGKVISSNPAMGKKVEFGSKVGLVLCSKEATATPTGSPATPVPSAGQPAAAPSGSKTCSTCGGSGRVSCGTCGGDGQVTASSTVYEAQVVDCPSCTNGYTDTNEICPTCHGATTITQQVPRTVNSSGTCSACGGSGMVTCPTCGGTGKTSMLDTMFMMAMVWHKGGIQ